MNLRDFRPLPAAALLLSSALATSAFATEVRVTIENLSPDNGTFLTPAWVGFHNGEFDSYDGGAPLRGTVERIAEDGNTGPLTEEFDAAFGTAQGTIPGPEGPIAPGESATAVFELDGSAAVRYFSYVSMVIPSNDAFIANGNPLAHRIFDTDGVFTPTTFIVRGGGGVNDAGTEVNDELPANTAFFGQAAPDTGVDENGVVTDFPGFLPAGSGGILDDERFADGQTILPGREVARITIEAVRTTNFRFRGDGAQEVPAVATEATVACFGNVSSDLSSLTVRCEHDVDDVTAAHIHTGERGENGPILFPFDDPTSPFEQTFDVSDADLEALGDGGLYVNVHSTANPGGEVRAQIDQTCFSGPAGLCLNGGRFQVSADWQTNSAEGSAKGFELTEDSGVLYFFRDSNIELDVKVLNGCSNNGHYWVFIAGLTNQGVDITVEDTASGQIQTYQNSLGTQFAPILDTQAFATCP